MTEEFAKKEKERKKKAIRIYLNTAEKLRKMLKECLGKAWKEARFT